MSERQQRGDGHDDDAGRSGHHHEPSRHADVRYLTVALVLISVFMVGEVVAAVLTHSLALLADAGHMLADAGALGASIWASRLALRPATRSMTYGFQRAEILSAAVNGVTLTVVGALVAAEAIRRLFQPGTVAGVGVMVVAAVGVGVNVAATMTVGRADRSRLNIAGSLAHMLTDLYAFIGTFVAGLVIVITGFERADAIASLLVVALMGRAAWRLLGRSGRILLEGAPEGVDLAEVRQHMLGLAEVKAVHDLHAWVVTSDLPAVSAHIVLEDNCFNNGAAPHLLDEALQACLAGHFDVTHSTFQFEPGGHTDHEAAQHQ